MYIHYMYMYNTIYIYIQHILSYEYILGSLSPARSESHPNSSTCGPPGSSGALKGLAPAAAGARA